MFKLTLALCVVAASASYSCDNSKNWINGMRYSQIALTDGCRNGICNANPKYGGSNSNAKALAYCKKTCNTRSGCTGFFFQQHNNGHEICGFYSTTLKGASRHGHKAGAVCTKTTGSTDCKFQYQAWTPCSKACGSGIQYRNVKVSQYPSAGGKACPGPSTRVCNSHKCGDCKFKYGTWTKCSKACGTGVQYRNVKVDTYPSAGGKACPGPSTRVCNSHKCKPVNCGFRYKSWTPCSKACGNGVQYRPIKVHRFPKHGGTPCPNKATRVCNSFKCSGNLANKFHTKHSGAPCKSTYCTYDGAHTEVFMKTRDDFGNILKNHERWHCEHTTGTKCLCTCAKHLPCRLRHHHKTGYTKDFKMCKPLTNKPTKPTKKWCKHTTAGDITWDYREETNKGDIHARKTAKKAETCRAKCNQLGDAKCHAFVFHPFGNCKFIKKANYKPSRHMTSGKGSLFLPC